MAGAKSPNAVAIFWADAQSGPPYSGYATIGATAGAEGRYDRYDWFDLRQNGVGAPEWHYGSAWNISAVSLFTPAIGATVAILFSDGNKFPYSLYTEFWGSFLLLGNYTEGQWDVNLTDYPISNGTGPPNWDKKPTSLIVVHTALGPELPFSAGSTLTPMWNSFLDQRLAEGSTDAANITRQGNPTWGWEAFPRHHENLNPNHNYLSVKQNLQITLEDPLPDYEAWIQFYIRLWLTADGAVTGRVQRWEYHVSSGWYADYVGAVLKPNVELGAERLNDILASGAFPLPSNVKVKGLYYLPGIQTSLIKPGEHKVMQGAGDVTIVLETF